MLVRVSATLVADEAVALEVAVGERLDHEQEDEEGDRVVEDLGHALRSSSSAAMVRAASSSPAAIAAASAADRGGVGELAADALRVEHQHVLAGLERVEREPVGEVAGGVDDQRPQPLVLRVAGLGVGGRGERLGAGGDLGPLRGGRALRGAAGGVGADAGAQLERRALQLELRRGVALRAEREQQVEPAVRAPVAHAGRPALGDADQPGLLQPLERLAHGMAARAELLAQPPLGRHGRAGGERAGQDAVAEVGVDAVGEQHWLDQSGALVVPVVAVRVNPGRCDDGSRCSPPSSPRPRPSRRSRKRPVGLPDRRRLPAARRGGRGRPRLVRGHAAARRLQRLLRQRVPDAGRRSRRRPARRALGLASVARPAQARLRPELGRGVPDRPPQRREAPPRRALGRADARALRGAGLRRGRARQPRLLDALRRHAARRRRPVRPPRRRRLRRPPHPPRARARPGGRAEEHRPAHAPRGPRPDRVRLRPRGGVRALSRVRGLHAAVRQPGARRGVPPAATTSALCAAVGGPFSFAIILRDRLVSRSERAAATATRPAERGRPGRCAIIGA